MSRAGSIRARLVLGGALVLALFLAAVGAALQRAHADSVRAAHDARLQGVVYLLLGAADVNAQGDLVMPPSLAEPRLSVPGSGLYAAIFDLQHGAPWRSASTVGKALPFQSDVPVGEWRYATVRGADGRSYLAAAYGVRWAAAQGGVPLVLSVLEDETILRGEVAAFERTLWSWLGGAAVLLLVSQTVLLGWGLAPLQRVSQEVARIEQGAQERVEGRYPTEIARLTDNLNALVEQERARQKRYREALSFLAHSLKTPLAVLRTALADPPRLPESVEREVARMDDIVQHQLARAAASGAARFVPPLALQPVADRIVASLRKVHADKGLVFELHCAPSLAWRIDEGDAFELLGNLLDNASKWAAHTVRASLRIDAGTLHLRVEDDGPGFSDTQSVLGLHVRGDERVPGHGVGLAVVSELVASHGGRLELARSALGGAQVDVTLPGA